MTDKPAEPLNLIERMAQRLAAEETAAANEQPASKGLIERIVQRTAQDNSVSPRTNDLVQTPSSNSVASRPAEVQRSAGQSTGKQVRLDFRALRQNGMITPDNMASAISNEFRGIKRRLLQKVRDPKTRETVNNLIMVTSSLPGEGKTFSSVNLALSLAAERGLRVLLIDADVIRPSVGNVFVSPPREGLTDLLSGKVAHVSDVLYGCVDIPNLAVIFAGDAKTNSPELLSSGQMASLCKELSTRYPDRVIVLDTPPVLASSEPAILATYVHQLIMVVSADQADRHQLRKSLDAISSCQNISLLFNKAPSWNEAEYTAYYGYANSPAQGSTNS